MQGAEVKYVMYFAGTKIDIFFLLGAQGFIYR